MASPYSNRPSRAFWKSAVDGGREDIRNLHARRFEIGPKTRVATAGSCFAQHIGAGLRRRNLTVLDLEPSTRSASDKVAKAYGYRLYSARYGNIYTARQLLQLVQEALGLRQPGEVVWQKGDRFVDALRPSVEPEGLDSPEEVLLHRAYHLKQVRAMLEAADVFVFTFGLTEAWVHKATGTVFPTAPETIAGTFDPEVYAFKNFTYEEVLADFTEVRELLRAINPDMRFLLTVSPVPLAATATDEHVAVATTYSKSLLRMVAATLRERFQDVDYFPSYEIITSPLFGEDFFEEDRRSVAEHGVALVMSAFFKEAAPARPTAARGAAAAAADDLHEGEVQGQSDEAREMRRVRRRARRQGGQGDQGAPGGQEKSAETVCEDALLEAFAK